MDDGNVIRLEESAAPELDSRSCLKNTRQLDRISSRGATQQKFIANGFHLKPVQLLRQSGEASNAAEEDADAFERLGAHLLALGKLRRDTRREAGHAA